PWSSTMRFPWLKRRTTRQISRRSRFLPRLEQFEDRFAPAVFTVTNTDDGGPGSLRQAMMDAESTANANVNTPDEIHFNILGAGVHTIRPNQAFPVITDPVIIDGYTQPGASPNTLAVGDNAVIKIEIDGSSVPTSFNLFPLSGDGSTVRGLCINHVFGSAFLL